MSDNQSMRPQAQAPQEVQKAQELLSQLLRTSVTAHTIDTFYDTALQQTILLIEKAKKEYIQAHPNTNLYGRELEDAALGVDVGLLLDEISKRNELVRTIGVYVAQETRTVSAIYVPPQTQHASIQAGSGAGVEARSVTPRVKALLYIIHNDIGLNYNDTEAIHVERGIVAKDMIRQEPYYSVELPGMQRIVFVCEEEGNATFVFDTKQLRKLGIPVARLKTEDKGYYSALAEQHPAAAQRIVYSSSWRGDMLAALTEPFSETKIHVQPRSDFTQRVEVPKKQEGWESVNELKRTLKAGRETIYAVANTFQGTHPEWFQRMKGDTRRVAVYYHPDLVAKLYEHFKKIPLKSEGWESKNTLSLFYRKKTSAIDTFVENFRSEHPEWFSQMRSGPHTAEHYHPDLVMRIREHFGKYLWQKKGWKTASTLATSLNSTRATIGSFAESFKKKHPEWFVQMTPRKGRPAVHYHPKLVAKIRKHFGKTEEGKNGWETANSLQKNLLVAYKTIQLFVNKFRTSHPEWFSQMGVKRRIVEHYHPDLVALVRARFPAREGKKEDQKT